MNLTKIFRKPANFFQLLRDQADFITKAADALVSYAETLNPDDAEQVKALEKQADQKRFDLVQALDNTFITPYDREDISTLSKALDDILDYFKTTVKEMEIYQIGHSTELCRFTGELKEASQDISKAVFSMEKKPKQAMQYAVAAKKCENIVESLYRHSVAALLELDDIKFIIKMREIFRHLSNCADRVDEASDCICHILMKEIS